MIHSSFAVGILWVLLILVSQAIIFLFAKEEESSDAHSIMHLAGLGIALILTLLYALFGVQFLGITLGIAFAIFAIGVVFDWF